MYFLKRIYFFFTNFFVEEGSTAQHGTVSFWCKIFYMGSESVMALIRKGRLSRKVVKSEPFLVCLALTRVIFSFKVKLNASGVVEPLVFWSLREILMQCKHKIISSSIHRCKVVIGTNFSSSTSQFPARNLYQPISNLNKFFPAQMTNFVMDFIVILLTTALSTALVCVFLKIFFYL